MLQILTFMNKTPAEFHQSQTGWIIFVLTIGAAVYWIIGKSFNVYRSAFSGAVFELLWLPSLFVLCILPAVSFFLWGKEKFNLRSLNLYSIIIALVVILAMMLIN